MKILLLAPAHESCARGNLVTVERWRAGLVARNFDVEVAGPNFRIADAKTFDLVHAHHAVHCGPKALELRRLGLPVVVSLGGTDLNGGPGGLPDPQAQGVYEGADRIIGPFLADAERLRAAVPKAAPFRRVRRGVALPEVQLARPPSGLSGLMAGGLRAVKGQLRALRWLQELRDQGVLATLRIAGPVIEADYFQRCAAAWKNQEAVDYLGVLSPSEVEAELGRANFFLNASQHEGASNALLEALAQGCPVAATRVAGNRDMLAAAAPSYALLFDDDNDGLNQLAAWLQQLEGADREAIASAARDFVAREFSATAELNELIAVYRELL